MFKYFSWRIFQIALIIGLCIIALKILLFVIHVYTVMLPAFMQGLAADPLPKYWVYLFWDGFVPAPVQYLQMMLAVVVLTALMAAAATLSIAALRHLIAITTYGAHKDKEAWSYFAFYVLTAAVSGNAVYTALKLPFSTEYGFVMWSLDATIDHSPIAVGSLAGAALALLLARLVRYVKKHRRARTSDAT